LADAHARSAPGSAPRPPQGHTGPPCDRLLDLFGATLSARPTQPAILVLGTGERTSLTRRHLENLTEGPYATLGTRSLAASVNKPRPAIGGAMHDQALLPWDKLGSSQRRARRRSMAKRTIFVCCQRWSRRPSRRRARTCGSSPHSRNSRLLVLKRCRCLTSLRPCRVRTAQCGCGSGFARSPR
jgi:hypothetical protein